MMYSKIGMLDNTELSILSNIKCQIRRESTRHTIKKHMI